MDEEKFVDELYYKYDIAQAIDFKWDPKNYAWAIGSEAFRALLKRGCVVTQNVEGDDLNFVLGISVEKIDTNHPDRILLYKEVV